MASHGTGARPRRIGLARALSKRGVASRSQATAWIREGRVRVDGRVVTDPEFPTVDGLHVLEVDRHAVDALAVERRYIALNKPRGLVTTACDEQARDTVYRCFDGAGLGWIAPVGRLDKASEGLLLFSSDPAWAARITDPATGPSKTYHVQVDRIPDEALLAALQTGVDLDGEHLSAVSARLLRAGERNAWLEIVLDEGPNRQIRRLLEAFDIATLRLLRVAIGGLVLGSLAKGAWRVLEAQDLRSIGPGFELN